MPTWYRILFQIWLFGYDISDVLMLFTVDSIHFMASKKKIEFLRPAEQKNDENSIPPVKLFVKNKVVFLVFSCIRIFD